MEENQTIEMGVCFNDGTWNTFFTDIPTNTPEDQIEEVGCNSIVDDHDWVGADNICHIFLYHYGDNDYCDEYPDNII